MRRKNTSIETIVIQNNWGSLTNALQVGSENYLFERGKGKSQEGLFHGGNGLRRAEFAHTYPYQTATHLQILALLYAIFSPNPGFFESRSTALALHIAKELIKGDYVRAVTLGQVDQDINTLSSDIFHPEKVSAALPSACNTVGTDTWALTTVNKTEEVREILQNAYNAMPDVEKGVFDSHVTFFKKQATQKHIGRTEVDSELALPLSPLKSR